MLNKLSYRNAKRQARDYSLFFITMIIAAALLYSFNALVFSDILQQLADISFTADEVGYLIIFMSLLSVVVLGWLVSYMMNVFLRKRSREFGTYMLLGVEKKQIVRLYVRENCIIGLLSLVIGWFIGLLLSQLLEALVTNLYGSLYSLSLGFSLKAAGLTIIYFVLIYIVSLFNNRRRIKKMKLIELLNYEKQNESSLIKYNRTGILIFVMATLCGIGSIILLVGKNDFGGFKPVVIIIIAFILIALCQYGLFIGLAPILTNVVGRNINLKYKGSNLFLFRTLAHKVNSISTALGSVATVFVLALLIAATIVSANVLAYQAINLEAFDLTILHMNEDYNYSHYENFLSETIDIEGSHSYCLYTQHDRTCLDIRNNTLSDYYLKVGLDSDPENSLYFENRYDSYIKYSDYCILREILGLEPAELRDGEFIIHCLSYLEEPLKENVKEITVGGQYFSLGNIYTETFSQYSGYGNGKDFIVVIPDKATEDLEALYSLFVAKTSDTMELAALISLRNSFSTIDLIDESRGIGGDDMHDSYLGRDYSSLLPHSDSYDFVWGKSVNLSSNQNVSTSLPMLYLAFVLCITGSVVLAVQFLCDNNNNRIRYQMVNRLGLGKKEMQRLLWKQITIYFALPIIPSLILSMALIYGITVEGLRAQTVPLVAIDSPLIWLTIGLIVLLFLVIYCLYAIASYVIAKRNIIC
ncbi:MAG: ABC transporter permease [Lachnospiraceae bacterium]